MVVATVWDSLEAEAAPPKEEYIDDDKEEEGVVPGWLAVDVKDSAADGIDTGASVSFRRERTGEEGLGWVAVPGVCASIALSQSPVSFLFFFFFSSSSLSRTSAEEEDRGPPPAVDGAAPRRSIVRRVPP